MWASLDPRNPAGRGLRARERERERDREREAAKEREREIEREREQGCGTGPRRGYRGTSLIRNSVPLEPFSRNIPRVLWWS